jgi:Ase1/PRC1/MAP65 family protein
MVDIFTDASLAAHEYEVKRLENLVNSRQNALSLVKKHMDLVAQKQHLEESSKDPGRLTQRGAQAAGRLLQEEKMRKRLGKELPKVNSLKMTLIIGGARTDWCVTSVGG